MKRHILMFMIAVWFAATSSAAPLGMFFHGNPDSKKIKIAFLSSPNVVGKYSLNGYNVSLATLLSLDPETYELKRYDLEDESQNAISKTFEEIRSDGMNGVLAALTIQGAKQYVSECGTIPSYIPTVHRREIPNAPDNVVFGGIDYQSQIEALVPHMSKNIAVFYDTSAVGELLKNTTEELFMAQNAAQKSVTSYPIDTKGDNIITHLSKPSRFKKRSILLHIPVVKSSIVASHMTFKGIQEQNILSTQINFDPVLLSLTQYNDRKNMIVANSLIDFPIDISETNALLNNDLRYDWILYSCSVGTDYLVSVINDTGRKYPMRIVNSQIIYPVRLYKPLEFGFEPL